MTALGAPAVRRLSIRVALTATALVAVVYLIVAAAVVGIVTSNLTGQVDQRLVSTLQHAATPPDHGSGGGVPEGPGDRPYGPQVLVWLVHPDGKVETHVNAGLPASALDVTGPETVSINNTPVRLAGMDLTASDGTYHLVVGQDVTDVNRAQSTLVTAELIIGPILLALVFFGAVAIGRRVATPIELARRRQLEFTADASHELRTPLSVIEAHTSLALTGDRDADWYRTAFEHVDNESKRMRRLLDDLLWLARFDATQGVPNAEPVDVGVLAVQTADRFGAIAEVRRLRLEVAAGSGSLVVTAPPEWLDRLLGVLLDNACKYSPDGGAIRVSVSSEGGRVQLTVDDAGPGIPADERSRIFDRFHRAS
ncbi:MAG: ATP-binding protein, partial [Chloroflexota bacterium]|nr:ATP-binding protein [Chloroflexota bacterium]